MEIRIGVINGMKEITLDVELTSKQLAEKIKSALDSGLLQLKDKSGQEVFIPGAALAYVQTTGEKKRSIGFIS